MRNTNPQNLPAGPPQDRLWTEDDLSAYMGFRSVSELIARHPNFPSPVPLLMQGRRWRCADVIAWVNHLCDNPNAEPPVQDNVIPLIVLTDIAKHLEEALSGASV
jgi:predicted DNA-binding transcriptional regulator AlpA